MNSSQIQNQVFEIYQNKQFIFYYVADESTKIHPNITIANPTSFSFYASKIDYTTTYENTNKYIDKSIQTNNVQINYSPDGLSSAIICAFLIYKAFDYENALKVMDMLKINQPREYYHISLKTYDQKVNSESKLMRSSIIINTEMDLESTLQNSLVQSEILNFPIFSQRLIETQRNSQILPSEYQAQSEIFNQQQISFYSFGQQDNSNICEEPQINLIQSSIILNKKS